MADKIADNIYVKKLPDILSSIKYDQVEADIKFEIVDGFSTMTASYNLSDYPEIDPVEFFKEEVELALLADIFTVGYDTKNGTAMTMVGFRLK